MSSLLTREAVVGSRTQAASLVGVGIAVWLGATVLFRYAGGVLLPPDDTGRVALVFVATVPVMAMLAFAVYSLLDVPPERRLTAATLLVLPGMVFDAAVVPAFATVFPNMAPSAAPAFGGLLLLAYASVLVTGVVPLTYVRDGPDTEPTGPQSTTPADRAPNGDPAGDTASES